MLDITNVEKEKLETHYCRTKCDYIKRLSNDEGVAGSINIGVLQ